jgi:fluoroacetyl-CoA thioesterase
MELHAGLAARVELVVTDADTAQALGSGDVPVLGTPRLIALAEAATVAATAAQLSPGTTTVGTSIQFEHQAATAIGHHVTVLAVLANVDGRRLIFDIVVREGEQQVAEGRVERIVVDRQRFVNRAFESGVPA